MSAIESGRTLRGARPVGPPDDIRTGTTGARDGATNARHAGPRRGAGSRRGYEAAVLDRSTHTRGLRRAAWLTLVIAGVVCLAVFLPSTLAPTIMLLGVAFLAVLGVMFLFSMALGLIDLSSRTSGDLFARAFVDADTSGTLVTDSDGRILYANRAYADLTGAVSGRDVRSVDRVFADEPAASEIIYRLTRDLASGRPGARDVRLGTSLGGDATGATWYRLSCRKLALPQSAGAGDQVVVWRLTDVTRERADQERSFRELQHAIDYLDRAPAGFMTTDADGAIVYLNATLAGWLGIDLVDFQPRSIKLADLRRGDAWNVIETTDARIEDCHLQGRDGTTFEARLRTLDAHGEAEVVRTLVLDRAALHLDEGGEAAARAMRVFNASPMAIASLGTDGTILQSNASFARTFHRDGERPARLVDLTGSCDETLRGAFDRVRAGEAVDPIEVTTANGEVIRVHLSSPGTDGADAADGAEVAILHALEVTDQRRLEREMARGEKMKAVGLMAGSIAHDFNNVLQIILSFTELLLRTHRPSDKAHGDLTQIKNTANKAASLVRQLLAYSSRQTLRPQTLSLPDVISDMSLMLSKTGGDRVKVDIRHGRDLWPVRADLAQIEQVIMNLCVNARDAVLEKDEEGGEIRLRTSNLPLAKVRETVDHPDVALNDYVMLDVTDTGTGMSKEVMDRIFDPFFSTKAEGKGTGLGLSTVYGIVQQSGGFVYPISREGEGTTFRILLPRYEGEVEALAPDAEKAAPGRDLAGSARILFVEDEGLVRSLGVRSLEGKGYEVHEAEDGEDALEQLEDLEVDLIVSDVMMPAMDGPTLFRHVREKYPDMPFIFASGYAEDNFERSLPNAGEAQFEFISKPYTLDALATKVKDVLEAT